MRTPEAVPFRGRAKRREVAVNLFLAGLGSLLVWGMLTLLPPDLAPVRAIVAYTVFAVIATALLAVSLALTRQLPTARPTSLGRRSAVVVRAWPGGWWHANALDLGLVALGVSLAAMAVRVGSDGLIPAAMIAAAGAWFLVRVALSLTGRRHNEALWLTAEELVHDSAAGRARFPRHSVARVRARRSSVIVALTAPAELRLCPRPWRTRRRPVPGTVVVDCSMMGHDPTQLARWLEVELELDRVARGS